MTKKMNQRLITLLTEDQMSALDEYIDIYNEGLDRRSRINRAHVVRTALAEYLENFTNHNVARGIGVVNPDNK